MDRQGSRNTLEGRQTSVAVSAGRFLGVLM